MSKRAQRSKEPERPTPEMEALADHIAENVGQRVYEQVVAPLREENLELRDVLQQLMNKTYVLLRSTFNQSTKTKPRGHFDAWQAANAADEWLEAHPLPTKADA